MGRPVAGVTAEDRIFALIVVNEATGCWEWYGTRSRGGYGRVGVDGRTVTVHRWVWEHLVGPIPRRLQLDHLCRNRGCSNPEHLEPVTNRINALRGTGVTARNAVKTHCAQGHPFDQTNTFEDRGKRACLTCRRQRQLAYYHRTPPTSSDPGSPGSAAAAPRA